MFGEAPDELFEEHRHRAIGVVYHPQYEHYGNYVSTRLGHRYDAVLYIDESHALQPLHMPSSLEHEVPETFPNACSEESIWPLKLRRHILSRSHLKAATELWHQRNTGG